MPIIYNDKSKEFHLYNSNISYIFNILENGQLGHLYFGKKLKQRESFEHYLQLRSCCHTSYLYEKDFTFSLENIRQEYPSYGTTDYREPAYQIEQEDGSRITEFKFKEYKIIEGKPKLNGLPATYTEQEEEAATLIVTLYDPIIQTEMILYYTIFTEIDAIARSVRFVNQGTHKIKLKRALSMSLDLYDSDFEMIQLDGAWGRERHITKRPLFNGVQSISSARGASSHHHNPFIALKRKETNEFCGEAYGFSLVYSGNFLAQAEVDHSDVTRVFIGINPFEFGWTLENQEEFQTPEAVLVYTDKGLNGMSQNYHKLYQNRLARGKWRDVPRPILINNWEATYFDFNEEKILEIAEKAKILGIELFVLDDGWFGKRNSITTSLGDWESDYDKLPDGVEGLADKITDMGLKFGLWFEPEMVNKISLLYEKHPDWVIGTPKRNRSHGRGQFVLDFSNPQVIEYLDNKISKVLSHTKISYVKWDMNRNITEAYGSTLPEERQEEFFHRYILGVYELYERLTRKFPDILFESCASGGGRFDPGMLYYAPQGWISDDTDAVERLKIQYGTSLVYPVSSMGTHVSAVPNHQVSRVTDLKFRADVAYFGTFGYELNIIDLSMEEQTEIKEQVKFYKKYRALIQRGTFYRLLSPFENQGDTAWIIVSNDKKTAIFGYYKVLANPNPGPQKIKLQGLDPDMEYICSRRKETYYGDELMNMGMLLDTEFTGFSTRGADNLISYSGSDQGDFTSQIYLLQGDG